MKGLWLRSKILVSVPFFSLTRHSLGPSIATELGRGGAIFCGYQSNSPWPLVKTLKGRQNRGSQSLPEVPYCPAACRASFSGIKPSFTPGPDPEKPLQLMTITDSGRQRARQSSAALPLQGWDPSRLGRVWVSLRGKGCFLKPALTQTFF